MLFIKSFLFATAIFTAPTAVQPAETTPTDVLAGLEIERIVGEDEICYRTTVDVTVGSTTVETEVEACAETASQAMAEFREAVEETQQ